MARSTGITMSSVGRSGGLVRINVFGEEIVIDRLNQYNKQKHIDIARIFEETGDSIVTRAKARVNVETGRLRSSLRSKTHKGRYKFEVEVGSDLRYALYVEFGTGIYSSRGSGRTSPWVYYANGRWWWTRGARPRPYLIPAYDAEKNDCIDRIRRELDNLE